MDNYENARNYVGEAINCLAESISIKAQADKEFSAFLYSDDVRRIVQDRARQRKEYEEKRKKMYKEIIEDPKWKMSERLRSEIMKSASEMANASQISMGEAIKKVMEERSAAAERGEDPLMKEQSEKIRKRQELLAEICKPLVFPSIMPTYNRKIELEKLAEEYLKKYLNSVGEGETVRRRPKHKNVYQFDFPEYALARLRQFEKNGNVEEVKAALWYMMAYEKFQREIVY